MVDNKRNGEIWNERNRAVRFTKMRLHNNGIFRGTHDFNFNIRRTLIIGEGKTTAAQALVQMRPVKGITPNSLSQRSDMLVKVETTGSRNLIRKYRKFIYLSSATAEALAMDRESTVTRNINRKQRCELKEETRAMFQTILARKRYKIQIHHDLDPQTMAAGEKICLGYAVACAMRKVLGLNLPMVLDSPYAMLDANLKRGFIAFLKGEPGQQIIFGSELDLREEGKITVRVDGMAHC